MRRLKVGATATALCGSLLASSVDAHGFGQRFDLPLPLNLWIWSAGGTIVLTFLIAALFIRDVPTVSSSIGLRLATIEPATLSWQGALIATLRVLAAALFVLTLTAGLLGAQDPYHNLAPTVVWVVWWVGIAYSCSLIGNVWGLGNPFATLFDEAESLYRAVTRGRNFGFNLPYPQRLDAWPAVAIFIAFTWSELLWSEKDVPGALARVALGYSTLTWVGMLIWGRSWLQRGEAFSIMFRLMGRFAPIGGRLEAGQTLSIFLRPPGLGLLDSAGVTTSFVVFVTTMLSSVTFDGFLDTPLYQQLQTTIYSSPQVERTLSHLSDWSGLEEGVLIGSCMLAVSVLVFCAALFLTTFAMRAMAKRDDPAFSSSALACRFVLSLVPIAIAYHLAHYLSLLLTAGQFILPLASDPFGWGWDLFGSAAYKVDIGIVGPRFFWYVSVSAILVGHIVSVYVAHVVSIQLYGDRRSAFFSQIPMVLLMVCYTMSSLWILAQPVVS